MDGGGPGGGREHDDDPPLVSVVITTRNRCAVVREAIESAQALKVAGGVEIVVVDDGSTDRTPAVLAALPVRVVRTRGLGMPGARNMGLHAARGTYVNFIDDDDVFTSDAVNAQLRAFASRPEYGAVFGRAQRTHPDLTPFGDAFPEAHASSGWLLEDLLGYQPQIGTMLARREALAEIGGFNPRYSGDDWDMYLRVAKAWQIGRISETVLLFRQRLEAEESQQWRRSRRVREVYRVNTDHLCWSRRLALLPVRFRIQGWNAYQFAAYAFTNWDNREYTRAARAMWYAIRWSPPHAMANLVRRMRRPGRSGP